MKKERALHKPQERLLRLFIDVFSEAVLSVNGEGVILASNRAAGHLFGYAENELDGHLIEELIPVQARQNHIENRAAFFRSPEARPMGSGTTYRGLKKNGTEFSVQIGLSPLETAHGVAVLVIVVDASFPLRRPRPFYEILGQVEHAKGVIGAELEEKLSHQEELATAQSRLAEAEKFAAIGEITASVAHEINTPLGAISSSNSSMKSILDSIIFEQFEVFRQLVPPYCGMFQSIVALNTGVKPPTAVQRRVQSREIQASLREQGVRDYAILGEILVEMGITSVDTEWKPLLFLDNAISILRLALSLSDMRRAVMVIETATNKAGHFVSKLVSAAPRKTGPFGVRDSAPFP